MISELLKVISRKSPLALLQVKDVFFCALKRLGLSRRYAVKLSYETLLPKKHLPNVASNDRDLSKSFSAEKDSRHNYGNVTLVGFGPGNPDLLTIGGDKAMAKADIIFHDDLLDKQFLEKYKADKVFVGKRKHRHSHEQDEINLMLLNAAMTGKNVVRLKGGDPMIFAHGGEEIDFLHQNSISVNVIPGVSTGTAVASLTQIPLTHRGISSSVAFITGHTTDVHLPNTDTLVCFMAGSTIHRIAGKAIAEGRNPQTPVMLAHNVSLPDQDVFFSTLEELALSETKYSTPIIIIIGDVVSLKDNFRNK